MNLKEKGMLLSLADLQKGRQEKSQPEIPKREILGVVDGESKKSGHCDKIIGKDKHCCLFMLLNLSKFLHPDNFMAD
jgi:hypothetical protein